MGGGLALGCRGRGLLSPEMRKAGSDLNSLIAREAVAFG